MFERGFVIFRHSWTIALSRNINHREGEVRVRMGEGAQKARLSSQSSLLVQHHLVGDSMATWGPRKLRVVCQARKRRIYATRTHDSSRHSLFTSCGLPTFWLTTANTESHIVSHLRWTPWLPFDVRAGNANSIYNQSKPCLGEIGEHSMEHYSNVVLSYSFIIFKATLR